MSILPQEPTETDVLSDRQDRIKRFLTARGDPNMPIPFQVLCMMLPQYSLLADSAPSRSWVDASELLSHESLKHAVTYAHMVDTELTILQYASLLERPHMSAAVLDNAQKPIALDPSPASLLPSPLLLAAMYKAPNGITSASELTSAASFGSLPVVEALLTRGVDPCGLDMIRSTSRRSIRGHPDCGDTSPPPLVTPLLLACLHGRHTIAAVLVQSGGVGHHPTTKTLTSLLVACALSCSIRCFMLIRRGREALVDMLTSRAVTEDGRTLLHFAAIAHLGLDCIANEPGSEDECSGGNDYEERRIQFCQLLVGLGCPVDACAHGASLNGDTALHLAWRTGNATLVRSLVVDMLASPCILNGEGQLPLECHDLLMSSAQIALHGGVCRLVQDSGPQSCAEFLQFLLRWVYPQCLDSPVALAALRSSLIRLSPRNGWNALHSLCASPYWMRHANQHDMVRMAGQLCHLVGHLLSQPQAVEQGESFNDDWINSAVVAEVAGAARMATPLTLALDAGAPLALIHLLLHYGADASLQPGGGGVLRLAPPLNAFQVLASHRDPFPHIGDAAMMLLISVASKATHDSAVATPAADVQVSMDVLNSITTHPSLPHASMTDVRAVQTHPYWQTFYEVLVPPTDEKDRRRREAGRFDQYHSGAVGSLIAEIEPVPPTVPFGASRLVDGAAAQFTTAATPLENTTGEQGAFVVVVHPEPRQGPVYDATAVNALGVTAALAESREAILRYRQEWTFQQRLSAILDHYNTSSMPARNFYYEQELATIPSHSAAERDDTDQPSAISLSEWITSLPEGSLVASYFIVRFCEWCDALEDASDGDTAYATLCDYARHRSLGLRRHNDHLIVDEEARQRDTTLWVLPAS